MLRDQMHSGELEPGQHVPSRTAATPRGRATTTEPLAGPHGGLLVLQRNVGNRAVGRLLRAGAIQARLAVNEPGDEYEQEADRVAALVTAARAHRAVGEAPLRIQRFVRQPAGQLGVAPPSVGQALAGPGRPLAPALRRDMEQRFGYDFSGVRVHTNAVAEQSARDVSALAYTAGHDIVFDAGQFAPGTREGRGLIAHELAHVVQQASGAMTRANGPRALQRVCRGKKATGNAILSDKEADYEKAVQAGRYCRDTGATGLFHKGRCYREVPAKKGFPPGDQVCFDQATGKCTEDSPDVVSAVEGQNADGSCNLGAARSLGHFAEDIFPSEPGIVGAGFGLLSGAALGYGAGLGESRSLGAGTGALLGAGLGTAFGAGSGPLARWLRRRGHVPVVGTSLGVAMPLPKLLESTLHARLYIGTAKRDQAILQIFYPELRLSIGLIGKAPSAGPGALPVGPSALTSLMAGIRIDPGKPGGDYISFFGGPALAVSQGDRGLGAEAGVAFGWRWRWIGVSANVGTVYDPTRQAGGARLFTLGASLELGPDRPRP